MIRCYHCGTDNLDGSEYCDECGTKLSAAGAAKPSFSPPPSFQSQMVTSVAPQSPIPPPPAFTRDTVTPKPATPYTPPPPPVPQYAQPPTQAPTPLPSSNPTKRPTKRPVTRRPSKSPADSSQDSDEIREITYETIETSNEVDPDSGMR